MDTEKVAHETACIAAIRVAKHFDYASLKEDGPNKFWAFVGFKQNPTCYNHQTRIWTLPNDVARRIKLLAGPHYRTIIRAMIANGASINRRRTT